MDGPTQSLSQAVWGWLFRPLILRLEKMEQTMAQEFDELRAAQQALGGEGGEINTAADRVIAAFNAAIGNLSGIVTDLKASLAEAQAALADAQTALAAGQQVATETTATITNTVDAFNTAEAKLNAASDALQDTPPTP